MEKAVVSVCFQYSQSKINYWLWNKGKLHMLQHPMSSVWTERGLWGCTSTKLMSYLRMWAILNNWISVISTMLSLFLLVILFYILATPKFLSGWVQTCDSAHSSWLYSAAPLGDQAPAQWPDISLRHIVLTLTRTVLVLS